MKHISYWESIDGLKFDDEIDCREHELSLILEREPNLIVIDREGTKYLGPCLLEDNVHNYSTKIIVKTQEALGTLLLVKDFTGFYYGVDDVGEWNYNEAKDKWEKA